MLVCTPIVEILVNLCYCVGVFFWFGILRKLRIRTALVGSINNLLFCLNDPKLAQDQIWTKIFLFIATRKRKFLLVLVQRNATEWKNFKILYMWISHDFSLILQSESHSLQYVINSWELQWNGFWFDASGRHKPCLISCLWSPTCI